MTPDEVFCRYAVRTVRNDNTITFHGLVIDLPPATDGASRAKQRVDVLSGFDGIITVKHGADRLALVLPAAKPPRKASKASPRPQSARSITADRIPELLADRV